MNTIGIVHGGSSSQLVTLDDPQIARHSPRALYLPDLDDFSLEGLEVVVICDRLHPGLLMANSSLLYSFAEKGGTLVVLGEVEIQTWLPDVSWSPRPTNFWWWLTGEDHGIRQRSPLHSLWGYLGDRAIAWHFHGLLTPPHGATTLLAVEEDGKEVGVLLYDDEVSTKGRIIATTLDPTYHHGSNFMPGATQFLYGLLDWLVALQGGKST